MPVTLRCVPARTWMTPATVSARRPRGSPRVRRPLRSRERCDKSPHRVALPTPLDDHVLNRRPLSRDRRPRSSGSRRAPVPESPIIAATCGFSLEGATLPAPTEEALQVIKNPAASRRPHGHPLLASHARGRWFRNQARPSKAPSWIAGLFDRRRFTEGSRGRKTPCGTCLAAPAAKRRPGQEAGRQSRGAVDDRG